MMAINEEKVCLQMSFANDWHNSLGTQYSRAKL